MTSPKRNAGDGQKKLLSLLYENSTEAILFFDKHNNILQMNPAAEQIIEPQLLDRIISKSEARTFCSVCKGYTSENELMTCESCFLSTSSKDFTSFQVYLDTKGKGVVPYAASFNLIDPASGIRVLMLRNLTTQLMTQETFYQNTMIQRVIQAQEDERKRISRELHDSVAQELLSSLVDLRTLKYIREPDAMREKVAQTEATMARLLDQIRNLSLELRPASLDDLGLEAALRSHFKWIEQTYGIVVHFNAELGGRRYNSEIETVIYRICQESVLNSLKYADVDEVSVRLFQSGQVLELLVVDRGTGFDVNSGEAKGTGLGLYGMRERAELVSGTVAISSEPGQGTRIHLQIPIREDAP